MLLCLNHIVVFIKCEISGIEDFIYRYSMGNCIDKTKIKASKATAMNSKRTHNQNSFRSVSVPAYPSIEYILEDL